MGARCAASGRGPHRSVGGASAAARVARQFLVALLVPQQVLVVEEVLVADLADEALLARVLADVVLLTALQQEHLSV